ncbi:MAG: hypothetical protein V4735_00440 [Pseudomonadota bacterium]
MTSISSTGSGNYINQLLGVDSSDSQNSILDAIKSATKSPVIATDSSSTTSGTLGLSATVLNLLQGTQGAQYMKDMLANGKSSPVSVLLGGSISSAILQSALKGARQQRYSTSLDTGSPVSSLLASYNATLNAASAAALKPKTITA